MRHQQHQVELEHQRLLRLAREYRQKGYKVTVHPSSQDLPPTLAGCPIGLIARGEDKIIAAEVRSRETLTLNGNRDLHKLAELVKQLPGWEFELVVTNPRHKAT